MFKALSSRGTSAALRKIETTELSNCVGMTVRNARKSSGSALPAGYKENPSKGPMLRFEESLPKLPVPSLEETAAKYLKSVQPLLTSSELASTTKAVQDFIRPDGVGHKLQEKLIARRNDPKIRNWLYDWWNDAAYLAFRDSVVYSSYFYSHRDDRKRRIPSKRAAAISTAVLEFKKQVDQGTLEPEYAKTQPMAMESYQWLFNVSRVPARPSDYPVKYSFTEHKHILVIRKNQFFKVMHEVDGKQLNTAELEQQFERVYAKAEKGPAVGALTTEHRDIWTDAREILLRAHPLNAKALKEVESASFVVCLDDASPVTLEERAHQYWHGDGANRWYDKPAQFIINDNGTAGFMGEHAMMDGTSTLRLNEFVNNAVFKNTLDFSASSVRSHLPGPTLIHFHVTKEVQAEIERAQKDFNEVIDAHELQVQAYQAYGKGLIKKLKCSPDAYVQMIIQLAYFKMYGKNRPTYESVMTRRFQQGRTEACRSVSAESVAFCKAMADDSLDASEKAALFHKALKAHVAYVAQASVGQGVDRHLFGLKKVLGPYDEVPAIYQDPAYAYSSTWFISTSQLSSEFLNGFGWSQVVNPGFGIAYMINENSINFNIVSKKLGSDRMSFYLNEAAGDIRDLLLSTLEPAKAKL